MAEAGHGPHGEQQGTAATESQAGSAVAASGPQNGRDFNYNYNQNGNAYGNVTYEQPLTTDSMGDQGNTYRGYTIQR